MKKLLLIGPVPPLFSYGGPTKSINGLNIIFSRSNIDFSILSPNSNIDGSKIKNIKKSNNIFYRKNHSVFLLKNFYKYKIIWINSFFDIKLLLLLFIRLFFKFQLVVSPRGQLSQEAINTSNPTKKQIFIKIIKLFKNYFLFHTTSDSETKNIKAIFKKIKYKQISNLFDLNYKLNNVTKRKFIFYSRIHKKKGLDILLDTIQTYNLKVDLDIYGFIEDISYWDLCKNYIDKCDGVKYMGNLKDGDISKLKDRYSFFILPTLNENFGHVIIELLSIGCIPIVSKNTTPFEKEISSIFSLNFELSDKSELKDVINLANNMSDDRFMELKSLVRPYFDKLNENQKKTKNKYVYFISDLLNEN